MSHPDPLFDPDNAYEYDDMVVEHDPSDILFVEYLLDVYEDDNDSYDDSMDGDHDSAMESAGWGLDEDYGFYGDYGEDY